MEKKKTPQKNNTVFVLFEGRETCREGRDEASFHSLAHSPNVCNIWTRPGVAGGLELLLGLRVSGRDLLPPRVLIASQLGWEQRSWTDTRQGSDALNVCLFGLLVI